VTATEDNVFDDVERGEGLITFDAVRKHELVRLPGQKPPDLASVYRWAQNGRNGVKLEYIQGPRGRATTRSAIMRFLTKMTAAARGESAPIRSPKSRARQLAAAEARLQAAGI
jgi:hypothetical protein